jgi:hypothetical protein
MKTILISLLLLFVNTAFGQISTSLCSYNQQGTGLDVSAAFPFTSNVSLGGAFHMKNNGDEIFNHNAGLVFIQVKNNSENPINPFVNIGVGIYNYLEPTVPANVTLEVRQRFTVGGNIYMGLNTRLLKAWNLTTAVNYHSVNDHVNSRYWAFLLAFFTI